MRELLRALGGGAPATVVHAAQAPRHEVAVLRLSAARARERLGWRPAWDLDDALRAIVDWYRAYQRGEDLRAVTLAQIEAFAGS